MSKLTLFAAVTCAAIGTATLVSAQSSGGGADLAKKLSNPVADLISVPFQCNCNGSVANFWSPVALLDSDVHWAAFRHLIQGSGD